MTVKRAPYLHIEIGVEPLVALGACISFDTKVYLSVLVEVSFLGERLRAVTANKRPLTSVNPHVVHEIVPLFEVLERRARLSEAVRVTTLKKLNFSLCLGVPEPVNGEEVIGLSGEIAVVSNDWFREPFDLDWGLVRVLGQPLTETLRIFHC